MNLMEQNLRELLELAVGEPPRQLTAETVRGRAIRRRVVQAGIATLAAVLLAGVGASLASGVIRTGAPPAETGRHHAGPPRYYIIQENDNAVRATATGRQTAVIGNPRPGMRCGGGNVGFAAADHQTFFMTCFIGRKKAGTTSVETLIYRFSVTGSGHITRLSLVKGGVLPGVLAVNIAAAPDGSEVAAEVLRSGPSGGLPTNAVPAGIFVINTETGAKAFWHTGPYVPGALQYADAQDMSFTRNGGELVVLQARCHRNHSLAECNGNADMQARAYKPADRGGSLEGGKILLNQSALKPHGTRLSDAFISPDGSALMSLLMMCPRHGTCTLSVVRISVATGRTVRVLYRVHTGTAFQGVFERFFSSDPSGRYLILDAGAGSARVNGWINHGKLVPLTPPDGNAPIYETW